MPFQIKEVDSVRSTAEQPCRFRQILKEVADHGIAAALLAAASLRCKGLFASRSMDFKCLA